MMTETELPAPDPDATLLLRLADHKAERKHLERDLRAHARRHQEAATRHSGEAAKALAALTELGFSLENAPKPPPTLPTFLFHRPMSFAAMAGLMATGALLCSVAWFAL